MTEYQVDVVFNEEEHRLIQRILNVFDVSEDMLISIVVNSIEFEEESGNLSLNADKFLNVLNSKEFFQKCLEIDREDSAEDSDDEDYHDSIDAQEEGHDILFENNADTLTSDKSYDDGDLLFDEYDYQENPELIITSDNRDNVLLSFHDSDIEKDKLSGKEINDRIHGQEGFDNLGIKGSSNFLEGGNDVFLFGSFEIDRLSDQNSFDYLDEGNSLDEDIDSEKIQFNQGIGNDDDSTLIDVKDDNQLSVTFVDLLGQPNIFEDFDQI